MNKYSNYIWWVDNIYKNSSWPNMKRWIFPQPPSHDFFIFMASLPPYCPIWATSFAGHGHNFAITSIISRRSCNTTMNYIIHGITHSVYPFLVHATWHLVINTYPLFLGHVYKSTSQRWLRPRRPHICSNAYLTSFLALKPSPSTSICLRWILQDTRPYSLFRYDSKMLSGHQRQVFTQKPYTFFTYGSQHLDALLKVWDPSTRGYVSTNNQHMLCLGKISNLNKHRLLFHWSYLWKT